MSFASQAREEIARRSLQKLSLIHISEPTRH